METAPRIRPGIEALPAAKDGREVLVLHDRTGISPDLVVDRRAAPFLVLLDGGNDLRDIQVALMRQGGLGLVPLEEIQRFVGQLDEHYLLANDRYREHWRELSQAYGGQRVREASHVGQAYPSEPEAVRAQLEGYFETPDGPGLEMNPACDVLPAGLILPHIDFQRGGNCYAWGYAPLRSAGAADLFVILGTCHLPMEQPFALTTKTFQTPLGSTPTATDLAEAVSQASGLDLFQDELCHRTEHTIEFQVLFLQHIMGERKEFWILPVLCGGFHEMLANRILPSAHEPYSRGLEALRQVLSEARLQTCVLASADLAHLGPQFGDPYPVQLSDLARIQREDQAMLQLVLQGNADGFYRAILAEGDRRRICGLPPIYTWLRLISPGQIRLLNYDQAYNPQATVTFASIGAWS